MTERPRGAIGFVVKSGWAAVVLTTGSSKAPVVADSRRIDLCDPSVPDSRQPFHASFGTARDTGSELRKLLGLVRRFGRRSVKEVIRQYTRAGHDIVGAGVVVGSLIEPERIANDHIRIHALEGQLFRLVVRGAVVKNGLSCAVYRERDLYAGAADALRQKEQDIRDTVGRLGRVVEGPWRAEQKAATVAAWLALAARSRVAASRTRRTP